MAVIDRWVEYLSIHVLIEKNPMPMPRIRLGFNRIAIFLCASVVVVPSSAIYAQAVAEKKPVTKVDWGAFFKQHWIDLVKTYQEQNKKGYSDKNVVLLGDSITEGFSVNKYFPDRHVLNRGISADVIGNKLPKSDTRGVLRRMHESVFDCNPSDVFLLIGINDLGMGHKPDDIEAGEREILDRIKKQAPSVRVHIQSLLPTRDNYAKHNRNVLDVNRRLQELAKEFGYDYIDLHSKMTDDHSELKKQFTADGLHLKDLGYQVWQAEIKRVLKW